MTARQALALYFARKEIIARAIEAGALRGMIRARTVKW